MERAPHTTCVLPPSERALVLRHSSIEDQPGYGKLRGPAGRAGPTHQNTCVGPLVSPTTGITVPSARFCAAAREPRGSLSPPSRTRHRPPEVSLASFSARPPDLQPRRLMDMDFVAVCPLVPSWLPHIRSLSIGPHLRYGLLQTPLRGDALAGRLPFTSTRLGGGSRPKHARHTEKGISNSRRRCPSTCAYTCLEPMARPNG
jgi:hypothetical protein